MKGYDNTFYSRGYRFVDHPRFGIGKMDAAELIGQLRNDGIRDSLLVYLDDWLAAEPEPATAALLASVTAAVTGQEWRLKLRGGSGDVRRVFAGELQVPWEQLSAPAVASLALVVVDSVPNSSQWAVEKMEAALARYPSDFWLHAYIGQEYLKLGKPEAAAGSFRAAVALRPDIQAVRNLLEQALRSRGK